MGHSRLVWVFVIIVGCCRAITFEEDVSAMNKLYLVLGSPGLEGWKYEGGDPCGERWEGVACQSDRIVHLFLKDSILEAVLGDELPLPKQIEVLDLGSNRLSGSIPELSLLPLRTLSLSGNRFTGEIPYLGLDSLETLDLADNNLSGPLPQSMEELTDLRTFNIQNNKITGNLSVLETLQALFNVNVENNLFSGPIPPSLKALPNFRGAGNHFDTPIIAPPALSPSPASPTPAPTPSGPGSTHKLPAWAITMIVVCAAFLMAVIFLIWRYKNMLTACFNFSSGTSSNENLTAQQNIDIEGDGSRLELPSFGVSVVDAIFV